MNTVFVDSSFWISLRDKRQDGHARAMKLARNLVRQKSILVVTLLVIAETHAYFTRSAGLRQQILDDFSGNPVFRQEDIHFSDQQAAISILRSHRDKEYSLCDTISFVVMRRLGIRQVASFDNHFRQFGDFEVLNAPD